jgi:putative Holliday junction resolvase
VIGFDYGMRRLGVAIGETTAGSSRPLETIRCRDGRPDWAAISRLVEGFAPDAFVVGMPDGHDSEHPLRARIERFCRQLRGRYRRPVHTMDERLSSAEARSRDVPDEELDGVAAKIILETWFNDEATAASR